MPFCSYCGEENQESSNFCSVCGRALAVPSRSQMGSEAEPTIALPYRISLRRVALMTVLTYGLYLFYWVYITWKQYRDQTGDDAYPVWHALTLLVPIYSLFRIHAHARTFHELMTKENIVSSINPWWVVLGILVTSVLWAISLRLDGGLTSIATLTQATVLIIAVLDVIAIPITAGLVIHMQSNLNRYWDGLTNYRVVSHRLGVGEIIFAIVGSLMWIDTLADIFNESWRTGF